MPRLLRIFLLVVLSRGAFVNVWTPRRRLSIRMSLVLLPLGVNIDLPFQGVGCF